MGNFIELCIQTSQPLIVIYSNGNFVHDHWGYMPIYPLFSYPFTSQVVDYLCKGISAILGNIKVHLNVLPMQKYCHLSTDKQTCILEKVWDIAVGFLL